MARPGPKPSTPVGARRDLPVFRVHVTPDERAKIRALATRWGCSEEEALRRAVAVAHGG